MKPWQFDPTKWSIWILAKLGLVKGLRTVPEEKILKAQIAEQERRLAAKLSGRTLSAQAVEILENAKKGVHEAVVHWETLLSEYREAKESKNRAARKATKRDLRAASDRLRESLRIWIETHRSLPDSLAA